MKNLITPAFVVAVGVLVTAAPAAGSRIVGESPECIVDGDVASFDIPGHPDVVTALHFPGQLKDGMRPHHWRRNFRESSYRPFVRGGLGPQGASHNVAMEVDGQRMLGPDCGV